MGKRRNKRPRPSPDKQPKSDFTLVKENPTLEEYYRLQLNLAPEDHAALFETFKAQLPVTFRVNVNFRLHTTLIEKLRSQEFIQGLSENAQLHAVPWYPGNLIWELNTSKSDLKRCPAAKSLHEFIQKCTDCGLISRQELVSMLPPLLLDITPGQKVLDMCAAPGSKTAQIAEMLGGEGVIVANDVDINRAFMMVHQMHRTNTANLLVTNHPAQQFPGVTRYQRVLCDVPCTGDGTMRKAPTKWKTWNVKEAVGIHALQIQIATRGFALLEDNGLMLYSTCSLNPIEDEAVVNTLLSTLGTDVFLEDLPAIVTQKYPGLRFRPGLTQWKVLGNAQNSPDCPFIEYTSVSDFPPNTKFRASMLGQNPNPDLQKCIRILPQDQNSGGFFLALLRKRHFSPIEMDDNSSKPEAKVPVPYRKVHKGITEYLLLDETSEEYLNLSNYYGLSGDFPPGCLFTPSAVHKKTIYLISTCARNVLNLDEKKKLRVANMGVKAFNVNKERATTSDCRYRICQDAAAFLFPYLTKRKFEGNNLKDLELLLRKKQVNLGEIEDEMMRECLGKADGYFVLKFVNRGVEEVIVVMKHIDARIVLMVSEEVVQGLLLLYDFANS